MSQVLTNGAGVRRLPMKTVVFFAGTPAEVAAGWSRLRLEEDRASLRIVAPARSLLRLENLASFASGVLWRYRPATAIWLWLRLWGFVGFSRNVEILCLSSQKQFRFLKLLAFSLRGRVSFSNGDAIRVPISARRWLWAKARQQMAARGPICVIGSASPQSIRSIVQNVRRRYPGAPVQGVLPASCEESVRPLFDSRVVIEKFTPKIYASLFLQCLGRRRFRKLILPWTRESFPWWKLLAWLLPLGSVEIHNENGDAFSGRSVRALLRHGWWRRRQERERRQRALPVGVVGSASSYYLEKILPAVRARYPGAKLHALLPAALEGPANGLFDSTVILRRDGFVLAAWKIFRARKQYQCWIVPCTNERYADMKCLAFLLPLTRRQIFNEQSDGFALREWRTLLQHVRWRLRDHLSFQIVAAAKGKTSLARLFHLALYAPRLLAGLALLGLVRFRARSFLRGKRTTLLPKRKPRVDLLLLGDDPYGLLELEPAGWNATAAEVRLLRIPGGKQQFQHVNTAIRTSDAEFICLLDSSCALSPGDWLDRLLQCFDDRVAQVGPQVSSPDGKLLVRGLVRDGLGTLQWNSDHATRWHGKPEWLEVEALPRFCLLLRRKVFSEVGCFSENPDSIEKWTDPDFCSRLSAHGWLSLCNQSVNMTHPAIRAVRAAEIRPEREGVPL